jgi:hypothetical protein
MAERQNGRMTRQNGRTAEWQNGRMAEWQNGRMAEWQNDKIAALQGCVRQASLQEIEQRVLANEKI